MIDIDNLVVKVKQLKKKGYSQKEISSDLHLSIDTVKWLLSGAPSTETPPSDVKIGWRSVGVFGSRIKNVASVLVSIIQEELQESDIDTIMGIAINGIPYAAFISEILGKELAVYKPATEPAKGGQFSSNFANVNGKKVIIIDDVISTGNTLRGAVEEVERNGGKVVLICVLMNKTQRNDVSECPLRALLRARSIGGTILGGGPLHSFPYA
ncbi:MAG: orotate phosphoribosyltransferase-like protein [Candidatus Thermoplasmatota archaeon]|jgi:orotate phosphoribosyltransferase|nr:orotate phosphoribosyltransferase-like protein [Candidatus Thermoplasmatota archaeon]